MSIVDSYLEFSDAQAVTTSAWSTDLFDLEQYGTADSSNVTGWQLPLSSWINVVVGTAFTGMDSGATINVKSGTTENATNLTGTITTHAAIVSLQAPWLVSGSILVSINLGQAVMSRYIQLQYVPGSEAGVAGTLDAWIGAPIHALNSQVFPS